MKKLSPAQTQFLAWCRESEERGTYTYLPPSGYSGAGPDASRWWRTAEVLMSRGLVERHGHGVRLTPQSEATRTLTAHEALAEAIEFIEARFPKRGNVTEQWLDTLRRALQERREGTA